MVARGGALRRALSAALLCAFLSVATVLLKDGPLLAGGAAPPTIHKFENGSTVFVWDDGRRLENAANGDKIFTNKDGRSIVTKGNAPESPVPAKPAGGKGTAEDTAGSAENKASEAGGQQGEKAGVAPTETPPPEDDGTDASTATSDVTAKPAAKTETSHEVEDAPETKQSSGGPETESAPGEEAASEAESVPEAAKTEPTPDAVPTSEAVKGEPTPEAAKTEPAPEVGATAKAESGENVISEPGDNESPSDHSQKTEAPAGDGQAAAETAPASSGENSIDDASHKTENRGSTNESPLETDTAPVSETEAHTKQSIVSGVTTSDETVALAAAKLEIEELKLRLDEALAKIVERDLSAKAVERNLRKEHELEISSLREKMLSQASKCTDELSRQTKEHKQKVMAMTGEKLDAADRLVELESQLDSCKIKMDEAQSSSEAEVEAAVAAAIAEADAKYAAEKLQASLEEESRMKKAIADFNLTATTECSAAIATVRAEAQAECDSREAMLKEAAAAVEAKKLAQAEEASAAEAAAAEAAAAEAAAAEAAAAEAAAAEAAAAEAVAAQETASAEAATAPETAAESAESAEISEDLVACRAHVASLESSKTVLEAEIVQLKTEKGESAALLAAERQSLISEITSNVTNEVTDSLTAKYEAATATKIAAAVAAVECPQPSLEENQTTSNDSSESPSEVNETDQMIVSSDGYTIGGARLCNCTAENEMLVSANAQILNLTEMLSKTKTAATTMAQAADQAEVELQAAKQEVEAARAACAAAKSEPEDTIKGKPPSSESSESSESVADSPVSDSKNAEESSNSLGEAAEKLKKEAEALGENQPSETEAGAASDAASENNGEEAAKKAAEEAMKAKIAAEEAAVPPEHRQLLAMFKHAKNSCQGKDIINEDLLTAGSSGVSPSMAKHVITIMDVNGDGTVDFSEFAGPNHKWHEQKPEAAATWEPPSNTGKEESSEASPSEAMLSDGSAALPDAPEGIEAAQAVETSESQEGGAAQEGNDGAEIQNKDGEATQNSLQSEGEIKQIEIVNASAKNETFGKNVSVFSTLEEAISVDRIHEIFRLSHQVCVGSKVVSALELFNIEKISADGVEYILNGMDSTGDRLIDLDDFLHIDIESGDNPKSSNSSLNTTDDTKTGNSTTVDDGASGDGEKGKDNADESVTGGEATTLELPTTTTLTEASSFIAAGYLASLVYICLAGCTCMSAATCMRQTTVLFWVAAISLSMLLIKTQVAFCADKDIVTCAISYALSRQVVALVVLVVYAIACAFARGTIVGSILTLPAGLVGAGLAISGGCSSLQSSLAIGDGAGGGIPLCHTMQSYGEAIFFCSGANCRYVISHMMPSTMITILLVAFSWVGALCMAAYYLMAEDEDLTDESDSNNTSSSYADSSANQHLKQQLQQKDREISDLLQKQQQLQHQVTSAKPAAPMGFPGMPSSGGQQSAMAKQEIAGLKQQITDLTTQNSNLSGQVEHLQHQLQQRSVSNESAEELDQLRKAYTDASEQAWKLEQSNKDLETRLQSTSQRLSGSNFKLKEVVSRFKALKEQNIKLKQKIERFRTQVKQRSQDSVRQTRTMPSNNQSKAVRQMLTTPGQLFPDTPSAI